METQLSHSTPGTHPVTAAGTHQGPPLIPLPQTDTVTCGSGAPGQPRGSCPRPPCPPGGPAQRIRQAQDHPPLTRPAAQHPMEGGAWISGIHTIPHTSFNQGTKCAYMDMGGRTPAHAQLGTKPRPCAEVLTQLQESKPHSAPVITASGHSPGARSSPRAAEDPPCGASYPSPVAALNSPDPHTQGGGAPSLAQLTVVTRRRRLLTPAGPAGKRLSRRPGERLQGRRRRSAPGSRFAGHRKPHQKHN